VIAIVGLLAAIALPSYTDYIRKSRRADGIAAVLSLQLAQEKYRANCTEYARQVGANGAYKCDIDAPNTNVIEHPSTSSDDHYSLVISGAGPTGYTLTATSQGGQTNDSCGNFILKVVGGTVEKSTSIYTVPDSSEAKRCWSH